MGGITLLKIEHAASSERTVIPYLYLHSAAESAISVRFDKGSYEEFSSPKKTS